MRSGALILVALWAAAPAHGATLDRVLDRIAGMGLSPLAAVVMNAAVNASRPGSGARLLAPGDIVVIGYTAEGGAVTARAGTDGLSVTDETAWGLAAGLGPGFYPVGSQLFALPPAGQLSLFAAAQDGRRLAEARDLALSRVDGSVTTVVRGLLLPELAPALLASVYDAPGTGVQIGGMVSTVLGAVNAGEIALALDARWDPTALTPKIDLAQAAIARGSGVVMSEAVTSRAFATSAEIGSTVAGSGVMMLNIASNAMALTGAVVTDVQGVTLAAQTMATTVLGAVNGGSISGCCGTR